MSVTIVEVIGVIGGTRNNRMVSVYLLHQSD